MATGNFKSNCNTKNIYAYCVMEDYVESLKERLQDEGQTFDEDAPIDYDDLNFWRETESDYIETYLSEELEARFGDLNVWTPCDRRAEDREASILRTVSRDFTFAGHTYSVYVNVTTRPGYYDGMQLDMEPSEPEDAYYLLRELRYEFNEGLAVMLSNKLEKRLAKEIEILTDQVDEVLAKVCSHKLRTTARFSNGETFYA